MRAKAASTSFPHEADARRAKAEAMRDKYGLRQYSAASRKVSERLARWLTRYLLNWRIVSPSMTSGGLSAAAGTFCLIHSAARRVDSSVPA
jgi:hypothetical protein